jgi:two-component system, chemotaxis family, CheB/CheR fusion protein
MRTRDARNEHGGLRRKPTAVGKSPRHTWPTAASSQTKAESKGPGSRTRAELESSRDVGRKLQEALDYANTVLSTVREPLLVLDEAMRVVTANRSFYRTFQVSPGETLGRCIYELGNHQWDIAKLHKLLEQVLPGNSHFDDYEITHRFERLGERTMLLNARKLYQDGERILLAFEDITRRKRREEALRESRARARRRLQEIEQDIAERKRAEAELRSSESRFRVLTEQIRQLVWTCDTEGRCDYLSPQWETYTGVPAAEQMGQGWVQAVHPEDQAHMWQVCSAAKEKGENLLLEYRLRDARGDYHWFKVAASPLRDAQGKVVKWLGTCTDIDEQKNYTARLERTVAERTTELRQALGELETFSYSIAHDMRAPLRAMQSFAHVLQSHFTAQLPSEAAEYVRRIGKSANRLDRLIQDVLKYTRVLRGNVPLERVEVDKLVRDMIAAQPEWQLPKADVAVEGTLPPVWANEAFLTQSISNLLSNAVKFVTPGTLPRVRVRAQLVRVPQSAERDSECVRLCFEDNGIGIASEDRERIFNLMDRIHPETVYEGTGLGLAIVRKALERMNGQVGVESKPGQGSQFWLQLGAAR